MFFTFFMKCYFYNLNFCFKKAQLLGVVILINLFFKRYNSEAQLQLGRSEKQFGKDNFRVGKLLVLKLSF